MTVRNQLGANNPNWRGGFDRSLSWKRNCQKRYLQKLRKDIISAYGGKCNCCGEDRKEFMCLDHINGGGNAERKSMPTSSIYGHVRRLGFPKDKYQLLCHNCNMAKTYYGMCPHVREREK